MTAIQGHAALLGAFDPDARALFARMNIPPAIDYANGINTVIVSLKQAGIWQRLDCFAMPIKAGDSQQGLLDWIRPESYVLAGSTAWSHDDGFVGYMGGGSQINTGLNLSTDTTHYTLADSTQFVYTLARGAYPALGFLWDTNTLDADETSFVEGTGGAYEGYQNGVHYYTGAAQVGDGLLIVNQVASVISLYKNGSSLSLTTSGSAGSKVNRDMILAKTNAEKIACYGVGASLDSTQRATLKTIIDNYMAAVA